MDALQSESNLHLYFWPQKYNNGTLFITEGFQSQHHRIKWQENRQQLNLQALNYKDCQATWNTIMKYYNTLLSTQITDASNIGPQLWQIQNPAIFAKFDITKTFCRI